MGMEAEILVIGPLVLLREHEVLDYRAGFYEGMADDALVLGILARAYTTNQSRGLAEVCGAEPWDFSTHKIEARGPVPDEDLLVGGEKASDIWLKIHPLLAGGVQLWYRPNG